MYKTIAVHSRSTYWTNKETNEEYSVVDSNDLAKEIELQCNNLEKDGFKIGPWSGLIIYPTKTLISE